MKPGNFKSLFAGVALALVVFLSIPIDAKDITLLNVSYDPTRELYQEFNQAFAKYHLFIFPWQLLFFLHLFQEVI